MASTKIINVLKSDKFEDVLDIFKNASAEEVIFILPKRSKSFSDEDHFSILNQEAGIQGKTVSFMCSNDEVNDLARKYGFNILSSGSSKPAAKKKPVATLVRSDDKSLNDDDEENQDWDLDEIIKEINPKTKAVPHDDDVDDDIEEHDKDIKKEKIEDEEEISADEVGKPDLFEEEAGIEKEIEKEEDEELFNEDQPKIEDEEEVSDQDILADTTESDGDDYTAVGAVKTGLGEIVLPENPMSVKIRGGDELPIDLNVKNDLDPNDEKPSLWQQGERYNKQGRSAFWGDFFKKLGSRQKDYIPVKSGKSGVKKVLMGLGAVALILFGGVIYISSGSAKIMIAPNKTALNIQLKVSASDKFSAIDETFNKIPGQLFTVEKTVTGTFDSTGEKDVAQKARGKITVYNEFSSSPQPLVASTRFQNKDGLIFRTLKNISVPGSTISGGKAVPGSIEVEVIADKSGSNYNIQADLFTLPAFKEKNDTIRFEKIYGKTTLAMKGGTSGKAKVVTDTDLLNAKNNLKDKLQKEIDDALKAQATGLRIISTSNISIGDPESSATVDEAADTFNVSLKGSVKTIGIKDQDLNELIKKYVLKTKGLTVLPDNLDISFINPKFDDVQNMIEFTSVIKGNGYAAVDNEKIISDLLGKNESQIKEYLGSAKVDTASVILSPFWVTKMPKNATKVQIEIIYK